MTRTTALRQATTDDAGAVASIAHALRDESNTSLPPGLDTEMARGWLTRIGERGAAAIALDGSIPVAFGMVEASADEPETAELGVWVLPDHRQRGIATQLAEELLALARERGLRRIRGRLPEGNEPALSFLSAIGGMVPLRNPDMTFELPL